jgi:hypothetical protein
MKAIHNRTTCGHPATGTVFNPQSTNYKSNLQQDGSSVFPLLQAAALVVRNKYLRGNGLDVNDIPPDPEC